MVSRYDAYGVRIFQLAAGTLHLAIFFVLIAIAIAMIGKLRSVRHPDRINEERRKDRREDRRKRKIRAHHVLHFSFKLSKPYVLESRSNWEQANRKS